MSRACATWMIIGVFAVSAAFIAPMIISILATLKAPTALWRCSASCNKSVISANAMPFSASYFISDKSTGRCSFKERNAAAAISTGCNPSLISTGTALSCSIACTNIRTSFVKEAI